MFRLQARQSLSKFLSRGEGKVYTSPRYQYSYSIAGIFRKAYLTTGKANACNTLICIWIPVAILKLHTDWYV